MILLKYTERAKSLFNAKTTVTDCLCIAVNTAAYAIYDKDSRKIIERGKHSIIKLNYMLADFPRHCNDNGKPLIGRGAGTFKF